MPTNTIILTLFTYFALILTCQAYIINGFNQYGGCITSSNAYFDCNIIYSICVADNVESTDNTQKSETKRSKNMVLFLSLKLLVFIIWPITISNRLLSKVVILSTLFGCLNSQLLSSRTIFVRKYGCDYGYCGGSGTDYNFYCYSQQSAMGGAYDVCCGNRTTYPTLAPSETVPPTLFPTMSPTMFPTTMAPAAISEFPTNAPTIAPTNTPLYTPTCQTIKYSWMCFHGIGGIPNNQGCWDQGFEGNGIFDIGEGVWTFPFQLDSDNNTIMLRGEDYTSTTWKYAGNESIWISCGSPKCWLSLNDMTIASNRTNISDMQMHVENGGRLFIQNILLDGNNYRTSHGQPFWLFTGSDVLVIFEDCILTNNDAMYKISNGANVRFTNCIFYGNNITQLLGFASNDGLFHIDNAVVMIEDCLFENNLQYGRNLFTIQNESTVNITNTNFISNYDAMSNEQMFSVSTNSILLVTNSSFSNNHGFNTIIRAANSSSVVESCGFTNNNVTSLGLMYESKLQVTGSVFKENQGEILFNTSGYSVNNSSACTTANLSNFLMLANSFEKNLVDYLIRIKGVNAYFDGNFHHYSSCNQQCILCSDCATPSECIQMFTTNPTISPSYSPSYSPSHPTSIPTTFPTLLPTAIPTLTPTPANVYCNDPQIHNNINGNYEYYLHIYQTSIVRFDTCGPALNLFSINIFRLNETNNTLKTCSDTNTCGSICLQQSQFTLTLTNDTYLMTINGPHQFQMVCSTKPDTEPPTSSPITNLPSWKPTKNPTLNPTTAVPTKSNHPIFNVSFPNTGIPFLSNTFLSDPYSRFSASIQMLMYDDKSVLATIVSCSTCFIWQYQLSGSLQWIDIDTINNDDISQLITKTNDYGNGFSEYNIQLTIQSGRRANGGRCPDINVDKRIFQQDSVYEIRVKCVVNTGTYLLPAVISNSASITTNKLPSNGICIIQNLPNLMPLQPYNLFCDYWDNQENLEYNA
eukprot:101752_1